VSSEPPGSEMRALEAGWQVSLGDGQMAPPQAANVLRLLAWRHGQLVFQMEPLGEVIEEVSRYGAGKIFIVNPRLRDLVVSGVFEITTPNRVLEAVEKTLHVRRLSVTEQLTFLY
jgi:transmembrane sensor